MQYIKIPTWLPPVSKIYLLSILSFLFCFKNHSPLPYTPLLSYPNHPIPVFSSLIQPLTAASVIKKT